MQKEVVVKSKVFLFNSIINIIRKKLKLEIYFMFLYWLTHDLLTGSTANILTHRDLDRG